MKENKAIIDLLAEGLAKQDKLNDWVDALTGKVEVLANNVNTLAEAMMDFKEILASQSRSIETLVSIMQEQSGDIRDIRYALNKISTVKEMEDLRRRIIKLENVR